MKIEQLFKKDITRDIQGVIKIGQKKREYQAGTRRVCCN